MAPQPKGLKKAQPAAKAASTSRKQSLRDRVRQKKTDGKIFIVAADADYEVIEEFENNSLISIECTNGKSIEIWENWLLDDAIFSETDDGGLQLNVGETITVSADGRVSWFKNRKPRKK
jgi:hypothetical protein